METFALYTLGMVGFVLAILISIGLHELGHMIPAKKFGAKVTQYFVGFGRTVWSVKRGETEYGLKAMPLGGYVRIIGMMPPLRGHFAKSEEEKLLLRDSNTGMFTGLISSAKKTEYESIDAADEPRLFYKLAWWKKFIVMAAGPSVNIVLAFLCFLAVFAIWGQQEVRLTEGPPVVARVTECALPPYGETAESCSVEDQSPAFKAGLEVGDRIVALDGAAVTSWTGLTDKIRAMDEQRITLTVERGGEQLDLTTTTATLLRPDREVASKTERVGYLGVAPTVEAVTVKHGPVYTLKYMGEKTKETFESFAYIPGKVKNVALAIVGVEERDPNGPVSIVGGARFSGEVASYESGQVEGLEITFSDKLRMFFMLVGSFNLFIGIFNFLPILPLDGGHMLGAVWEGVKRGFAKLFRRPAPMPVDVAKMLPIAYGFGIMLFMVGLLLIAGDILVPIRLFE